MKLIDWNILNQNLKKIFIKPEQKPYLLKLLENIEKQDSENKNLPFKIIDIREKGFIVKVCGLRGYISFNHMPWTYNNNVAWNAVFPYLKGKLFFSKIYQIQKDPVSIMLNGEIPQFKEPELSEDKMYNGIILNKTVYGIFVDIGYALNWKSGSLVGLLHKSHFETKEEFEKTKAGEIIKVLFWGYNEKEQLIFGLKAEFKEWFTNAIEKLIGEVLPVNVVRTADNNISYFVRDCYTATLLINKSIYPVNKTKIKKAVRYLKDGEIIHCEIISINKPKRTFQLKWETSSEIEGILSRYIIKERLHFPKSNTILDTKNTIENIVGVDIVEKLNLIGKTVKVEIIKKKDYLGRTRIKYLVESKHKGKLNISSESYKITNKEKKQIEKNLQEAEVLTCEVLNIEKNFVSIKWSLKEDELVRLLRP